MVQNCGVSATRLQAGKNASHPKAFLFAGKGREAVKPETLRHLPGKEFGVLAVHGGQKLTKSASILHALLVVFFTGKGQTDTFADNQDFFHLAPHFKTRLFSLIVAIYMNFALNSKIFSSCSEAFIEPQNPVEPALLLFKLICAILSS